MGEGDVELGISGGDGDDKTPDQMQRQPSVDLKPKDLWFYATLIYEEVVITDDMPNLVQYLCPYDPDEVISPWTYMWMSIIITLRGISQVYLCAHPVTAILICIGISSPSLPIPYLSQLLVCPLVPSWSTH